MDIACVQCGSCEDATSMLLCSVCDRGYHLACLRPKHVRTAAANCGLDWRCADCGGPRPATGAALPLVVVPRAPHRLPHFSPSVRQAFATPAATATGATAAAAAAGLERSSVVSSSSVSPSSASRPKRRREDDSDDEREEYDDDDDDNDEGDDTVCTVCGSGADEEHMLLCDLVCPQSMG